MGQLLQLSFSLLRVISITEFAGEGTQLYTFSVSILLLIMF